MSFENLDSVLGIAPSVNDLKVVSAQPRTPVVAKEYTEIVVASKAEDAEDDYQQVRLALKDTIAKAVDNLDEILIISKNSESPRSFEVAANFMKTLSDLTDNLMKLHKDTPKPETNQQADVINNTQYVFSGSPSELLRLRNGTVEVSDADDEED